MREGARLSVADKATVTGINQQLASLYTKFAQNELADEETDAVILDSVATSGTRAWRWSGC